MKDAGDRVTKSSLSGWFKLTRSQLLSERMSHFSFCFCCCCFFVCFCFVLFLHTIETIAISLLHLPAFLFFTLLLVTASPYLDSNSNRWDVTAGLLHSDITIARKKRSVFRNTGWWAPKSSGSLIGTAWVELLQKTPCSPWEAAQQGLYAVPLEGGECC